MGAFSLIVVINLLNRFGLMANLGMNFGMAAAIAHAQGNPQEAEQAVMNGYQSGPQYYQNSVPPPPIPSSSSGQPGGSGGYQEYTHQHHFPHPPMPYQTFRDYSQDTSAAFSGNQQYPNYANQPQGVNNTMLSSGWGKSGNARLPPMPENPEAINWPIGGSSSQNPPFGGAPAPAGHGGNPPPPFAATGQSNSQKRSYDHGNPNTAAPGNQAGFAVGPTAASVSDGRQQSRLPPPFAKVAKSDPNAGNIANNQSNVSATRPGQTYEKYEFPHFVVDAPWKFKKRAQDNAREQGKPIPDKVLRCTLCNVYSNNPYQMNCHIKGKPHAERLAKYIVIHGHDGPIKKKEDEKKKNNRRDFNNRRNFKRETEDRDFKSSFKSSDLQDDGDNPNNVPVGNRGPGSRFFGGGGRGRGGGNCSDNPRRNYDGRGGRFGSDNYYKAQEMIGFASDVDMVETQQQKKSAEQEKLEAIAKRNETFGKPPEPIKVKERAEEEESLKDKAWQPR